MILIGKNFIEINYAEKYIYYESTHKNVFIS